SIAPDDRVRACLEHTLEAAQVPPVWEEGLTGKGVRLALLDTGIDRGHPDFEGRVAAFEDFTGRGVRDDSGHGTYVASVAACSGEASRGRYRGVAPAASLLVGRVLDSDGRGRMSDVMAGLLWAIGLRANIVNLSLASEHPGSPADPLSAAAAEAVAQGIVVCAPARGPDGDFTPSPAAAPGVIRVAAYDPREAAREADT